MTMTKAGEDLWGSLSLLWKGGNQMSFYGAEKEFIFHLWLKTRKDRLEQALGIRLGGILLERKEEGQKPIDMYALDGVLGRPVLVESQLGRSDPPHFAVVRELIHSLGEGTVVYQALSFQDKHIREFRNLVETSGKPIRLYLVIINQDVLKPLTELDRLNKLDVYHNLWRMDKVANVLQVVKTVEHPSFRALQHQQIPNESNDLSSRIGANKFLIEELRRNIPEFLPFHREKTLYPQNPVIYFGAGASGLTYHCSVRDSRGFAFVDLRFSEDRNYLFHLFAMKPNLLKALIDKRVYVGDDRIGVQFRSSPDVRANVRQLVKIFRAMIDNISRPLYDILDFEYEVMAMRKRRTA